MVSSLSQLGGREFQSNSSRVVGGRERGSVQEVVSVWWLEGERERERKKGGKEKEVYRKGGKEEGREIEERGGRSGGCNDPKREKK